MGILELVNKPENSEIKNGNDGVANITGDYGAPMESVADIIARGAQDAVTESGTGAAPGSETGDGLTLTDKPKRRRRKGVVTSEQEQQQEQLAKELEVFFTPEGIGKVFTNGLDAFFTSCGAVPLTPEEQPALAATFALWTKYRMPASAGSYQPDLLLGALVSMAVFNRAQPIAEATAPFWRRALTKLAAPFRRRNA